MNKKPFKTIEEQINILKKRNLYFGEDTDDAQAFLLRNGYYSVINGYKDSFLDAEKKNELGHDFFKDVVTFSDFKLIYIFDTQLRNKTLPILMEAESIIKNSLVYAFCFYHYEEDSYLDPSNYCLKNEYSKKADYTRNFIRLLNTLQKAHDNKGKAYIKHYLNDYGHVPLWVISNVLTFGNISAFYDLQKQNVKSATCRNIGVATGNKRLSPKKLTEILRILVPFRNICAHGERLYCARVGNRRAYSFKDMIEALKIIIPSERMSNYLDSIKTLFEIIDGQEHLKEELYDGMKCRF